MNTMVETAARLFVVDNLSKAKIAEIIGCTKSEVIALLKEAARQGIEFDKEGNIVVRE